MVDRTMWTGSASDLLRLCAESARDATSGGTAWAKNPRALAGRLRRAQTFLRTLGIEITFSREGRTGTRIIRVPSAPSVLSALSAIMGLKTIEPASLLGSETKHPSCNHHRSCPLQRPGWRLRERAAHKGSRRPNSGGDQTGGNHQQRD
jgi:hypothetical protein